MKRTFFAALIVVALNACGGRNASGTLPANQLAAQEARLVSLEERLAALEAKTSRLDGVAEGVQILLERLGNGAGQKRTGPDPDVQYSVPIDGDPYLGPKDAKVTVVKGYDFYCGYCDKARPAMNELRKIYGKDVKIVFKNFVIHEDYARLPALAACAAHQQGKFTPMFDQIWVDGIRAQQELTEDKLLAMARGFKLNMTRFKKDMYSVCANQVRRDFEQLAAVGATGTPAFFINGRFIAGALPVHKYQAVIDEELDKANKAIASGVKLKDYYQSIVDSGVKEFSAR